MTTTKLNVEGMSCNHCVKSVNEAVSKLTGVKSVNVDLAAKTVTVEHDQQKCTEAQIKSAIDGQGFEVV